MNNLIKTLTIFGIIVLLVAPVSAEILPRAAFSGIDPETFGDYAGWNMQDRDYDFGPFSIVGWFDTGAFQMPIAMPVEVPAIGGDHLTINLHPAAPSFGFDFGAANFGASTIAFLGIDETGAPIELASFMISELMEEFSGPAGYQGFVGFRDDLGREIHQVTVGPIDLYLDNVYVGIESVDVETATLGGIKTLFK